jgi:hypothetical protein
MVPQVTHEVRTGLSCQTLLYDRWSNDPVQSGTSPIRGKLSERVGGRLNLTYKNLLGL